MREQQYPQFKDVFEATGDNIQQIKSINFLIRNYPNQKLIPQLQQLAIKYPCYRPVKGDGNCFYRAVAFFMLRQKELDRFQNIFQPVQNVCKDQQSKYMKPRYTFHQNLKMLYQKYLQPIKQTSLIERQNQLEKLFKIDQFDHMMIMYYRSLNSHYLNIDFQRYQNFIYDRSQLDMIKQFGHQSEGIQLNHLADVLGIHIKIHLISQTLYKQQSLNFHQERPTIQLCYRPGHYDLVYHQDSYYINHFIHQGRYYLDPQTPIHQAQKSTLKQRIFYLALKVQDFARPIYRSLFKSQKNRQQGQEQHLRPYSKPYQIRQQQRPYQMAQQRRYQQQYQEEYQEQYQRQYQEQYQRHYQRQYQRPNQRLYPRLNQKPNQRSYQYSAQHLSRQYIQTQQFLRKSSKQQYINPPAFERKQQQTIKRVPKRIPGKSQGISEQKKQKIAEMQPQISRFTTTSPKINTQLRQINITHKQVNMSNQQDNIPHRQVIKANQEYRQSNYVNKKQKQPIDNTKYQDLDKKSTYSQYFTYLLVILAILGIIFVF